MESGERILDHWEFPLIPGFFFWFPSSRLGTHFFYARLRLARITRYKIIVLWQNVSPSRAWAEIAVPKQELGNEEKQRIPGLCHHLPQSPYAGWEGGVGGGQGCKTLGPPP